MKPLKHQNWQIKEARLLMFAAESKETKPESKEIKEMPKTGFAKILGGIAEMFPLLQELMKPVNKVFSDQKKRFDQQKKNYELLQKRIEGLSAKQKEKAIKMRNSLVNNPKNLQMLSDFVASLLPETSVPAEGTPKKKQTVPQKPQVAPKEKKVTEYELRRRINAQIGHANEGNQQALTEVNELIEQRMKLHDEKPENYRFRPPLYTVLPPKVTPRGTSRSAHQAEQYDKYAAENAPPVDQKEQRELKKEYEPKVKKGLKRFDHLKHDSRYGAIMDRMDERLDLNKKRGDTESNYSDISLAHTRMENLDRNVRMEGSNDSISTEKIIHNEYIPAQGFAGDSGVVVTLPEDPNFPGETRKIVLHDPRSWGDGIYFDSASEQHAMDSGIHVKQETYPNGRVRGMRLEFTKPGTYYVSGKKVEITQKVKPQDAGSDTSSVPEYEVNKDQNFDKAKDSLKNVPVDFGEFGDKYTKRSIDIQEQDGHLIQLKLNGMKPGEVRFTEQGVVVTREPGKGYKFTVSFKEPGYYALRAYTKGMLVGGQKVDVQPKK